MSGESKRCEVLRTPGGLIAVDQGVVSGYPITYNPDDNRFYVHRRGTRDGTNVLGRYRSKRSAVARVDCMREAASKSRRSSRSARR